jgi:hypothetical protein
MDDLDERIEISKEVLFKAVRYLRDHWDEGPCCEGWQSKELINLIADMELALGVDPRQIWREY